MFSNGKHSWKKSYVGLLSWSCTASTAVSMIAIALTLEFVLLQPPAFAIDNFKQGMQFYKKKDYPGALKLFQKALADDPYNAELHYYMANAHVFQNDGEAAMKEYSQCFDLEPMSSFGQYSRQALLAFGKKFKGFSSAPANGKKRVAPDDAKSIKQALALIKGQTCDRENIHHGNAENAAKVAVAVGEERDHRISKSAQDLVEDITTANKNPSPALQEELHEIQQRAVFEGQRARLNAQEEAARHMTAAALRSTHVETSANSLLSLISENPRPGHIKMKAAGTNLYVRNYDFEPAPPLEPLTASWQLLPQAEQKMALAPGDRELVAPKIRTRKVIRKTEKASLPIVAKNKLVVQPSAVASADLKSGNVSKKEEKGKNPWDAVFVPGTSKVVVTDSNGRVLLHLRDDGNK